MMIQKIKQFIEKYGVNNVIIGTVGVIVIISGIVLLIQRRAEVLSTNLEFNSSAIHEGKPIDPYYTCDGQNIEPEISITAIPTKARTISVILEDQNFNNSARKGNPYAANLIAWNIPATEKKYLEGERPPGTIGKNYKERFTYEGPCPEPGETHTYKLTLYATEKDSLPISTDAGLNEAKKIIEANAIAKAEKLFTYTRQK